MVVSRGAGMGGLVLVLLAAPLVSCGGLQGRQLVVSMVSSTPYYSRVQEDRHTRQEGLLVDLLARLGQDLGFSYTIQQVSDGSYGKEVTPGRWTGMVGEVVRGEVDMALADLTITSAREAAVDFTLPYMSLGLGVLYTREGATLHTLEELAEADTVEVGAVVGGSTSKYFQTSSNPVHQKIWRKMQESQEVRSNTEGVERVVAGRGGFAFIMETPSINYHMSRHCYLRQIGDTFKPRGYGIAVAQGSPLREELSQGILHLQQTGWLEERMERWGLGGGQGSSCLDPWLDWTLRNVLVRTAVLAFQTLTLSP